MDQQQVINALFGVAGFFVAWWVNTLWAMVKSQQEQITAVNLKLAEHYVQKAELEKTLTKIFDTMDEIKKDIAHMSRNQASFKALNDMLVKVKQ